MTTTSLVSTHDALSAANNIANYEQDKFYNEHIAFLSNVETKLCLISKSLDSFIVQSQSIDTHDHNKRHYEEYYDDIITHPITTKHCKDTSLSLVDTADDDINSCNVKEHNITKKNNIMVITPDRLVDENSDNIKAQSLQYADTSGIRLLFDEIEETSLSEESQHHIIQDKDTSTTTDGSKPIPEYFSKEKSLSEESQYHIIQDKDTSTTTDGSKPIPEYFSISPSPSIVISLSSLPDTRYSSISTQRQDSGVKYNIEDNSKHTEAMRRLLKWVHCEENLSINHNSESTGIKTNTCAHLVNFSTPKSTTQPITNTSESSLSSKPSPINSKLKNDNALSKHNYSNKIANLSTNIISVRKYCIDAKCQLEDAVSVCDRTLAEIHNYKEELSCE